MIKPHLAIQRLPNGSIKVLSASTDGEATLQSYKEATGEVYYYRLAWPDRYKSTPESKASNGKAAAKGK